MPSWHRLVLTSLTVLATLCGALWSAAQPTEPGPRVGATPQLEAPASLGQLDGRPLRRIEVVRADTGSIEPVTLARVRLGQPLSTELARRAMLELSGTSRYAELSALALPSGDGVLLRLVVMPRYVIANLRVTGPFLDLAETRRVVGVGEGDELTPRLLPTLVRRVQTHYAERGFPLAEVRVNTIPTDDPQRVVLLIEVEPGAVLRVERRVLVVSPYPPLPELSELASSYPVRTGDRVDQEVLVSADRDLEQRLRARGWFHARVSHHMAAARTGQKLEVVVQAGPAIRLRFEQNRHFDASQLTTALELEERTDRDPQTLTEALTVFYRKRGFLDVDITVSVRASPRGQTEELLFTVREGTLVRVRGREYPCLSGERTPGRVSSEIDGWLAQELPGGGVIGPVDARAVDQTLGPRAQTGSRAVSEELDPWQVYVPDVYEAALKRLQELYRSEGYLSATVGPVYVLRRRCAQRSPAGTCRPIGPLKRAPVECRADADGLPLEEPAPPPGFACESDPARGVRCEPDLVLEIPIKLGPRSDLYDIAFEGNTELVERELLQVSELETGKPASQVELEKARRRLLDAYAEEGFAFAQIDTELDLSSDHTRARVRYVISERERVRVTGIVIRGATRTSERLIRSRVALEKGELYRRSLVRKTEERLATLGVFSTVTVGFEDPTVPAREKMVVITVQEKKPQYLDVRPGFSTGEGFRTSFEYGHRNLGGEAIQLTLRSQLGYLPTPLILEDDVRRKYEELSVGERLERRNSVILEFPEIGLGPLFRFSVEGVDVRDNARDFGLTRDAVILTLNYRPERRFSAHGGPSLELNDAEIFGNEQKDALNDYITKNPAQRDRFRVPQGKTVAAAFRVGFSWDRRDNPFDATRGTLLQVDAEPVIANPAGGQAAGGSSVFAATESRFVRFTNRLAGYIRLSEHGLALAASFRWGLIQQLTSTSRTYPDRLFFLGGVDSLRGFLQDSMMPEDIAQELLRAGPPRSATPCPVATPLTCGAPSNLTLDKVVIRGGDVFLNPRLELRIPLSSSVQTAVFLDSGNLWTDPDQVEKNFVLRYAAGTGIRFETPIGPLVFDYGFNLERVLDQLDPGRQNQRYWEDLGAFHFSIGVF